MSQAVSSFLSNLMVHFPFRHENEERETAWVTSMVRELRGFDPSTLDKAAEEIIRHRTDRRFPLPSDCRKACLDAKKWIEAERRSSTLPIATPTSEMQWDARQRLADDLVQCPLGKQAANEGWIGAMHAYAVKYGRLPTGGDIARCKSDAKEFDAAYALCIRGGWPQAGELQKLGASMLKRRQALVDRVLHGVVK